MEHTNGQIQSTLYIFLYKLYAHWKSKTAITNDHITITNKTTTYNKETVTLDMSNRLGLDVSGFTVSYKRKHYDPNWSTSLPLNAGTYDVRLTRAEDDQCLACELTFDSVLVINKASRNLDASQFKIEQHGYTVNVAQLPDNADGAKLFCLVGADGSVLYEYGTVGGFEVYDPEDYPENSLEKWSAVSIKMKIEESENYFASNEITSNKVTFATPQRDFRDDYKLYVVTKTVSRNLSLSATDDPLYADLVYVDDSVAGVYQRTKVSNTSKGATSTDYFTKSIEPWAIQRINWMLGGNDAWRGYEMTTRQGATLDYTITKDGTDLTDSIVATFITSTAAQSSTIHIVANDPEYAGEYKDTVTFTIGVKKPAPTLISFTLDGDTYQAEEGMTWAEWVESAYNNGGFYSAYESVYWGEDFWFILCNSGKTPIDDDYYVNEDDVIQANTDYVLVEMTEA